MVGPVNLLAAHIHTVIRKRIERARALRIGIHRHGRALLPKQLRLLDTPSRTPWTRLAGLGAQLWQALEDRSDASKSHVAGHGVSVGRLKRLVACYAVSRGIPPGAVGASASLGAEPSHPVDMGWSAHATGRSH